MLQNGKLFFDIMKWKETKNLKKIVRCHFLVLIMYYRYVRYYQWGKLGELYTGLTTLFCNYLWVYDYFQTKRIKKTLKKIVNLDKKFLEGEYLLYLKQIYTFEDVFRFP